MKIIATPIEGLFVIQLEPRGDHRGYFMRTYDRQIAADHGLQTEWLQENQSLSGTPGTVRGLHFQRPPFAETKLVRALSGALLDVVVDVRRGSATYGQHFAVELTATNHKCLYIPKGFAHGFCTLQPNSILAYKVDQVYTPHAEGGLLWNDPALGIAWPLQGEPSTISEKDTKWPCLAELQPLDVQPSDASLEVCGSTCET